MFAGVFKDKVVWLSGHTGFKGAWLATWLLRLGARVHGFSLPPPTQPALFEQLGLANRISHELGDIRNAETVARSLRATQPDFVFHLAAQALVRPSYAEPLITYDTNVMGTANVLDALRSLTKDCAAVMVTTDKCYENLERVHPYAESDHLGGHDPYSSSKAGAELVISAYRRSFLNATPVRVASARAGNVIGGGDWALDRILPDCIRALQRGEPIGVRNPDATRPWQHVLEPLSGYLWLAALLSRPELLGLDRAAVSSAFNFGPELEANRRVGDVVEEVLRHWPGRWTRPETRSALHEARLLMLDTTKAKQVLHWRPGWNFEAAIGRTVNWYQHTHRDPAAAESLTLADISAYEQAAHAAGIAWAVKNGVRA